MIFRLICVAVIATIFVETKSSPLSTRGSGSIELTDDDYDYRRMSSETEDISFGDVVVTPGIIQKAIRDIFRQMRRNTFRLIDSGGEALETGVRISKKNLLETIDPVKNALKANVHAAQKLGQLAISTVAQVPAFGMRFLQNFSDDSGKSGECAECLG